MPLTNITARITGGGGGAQFIYGSIFKIDPIDGKMKWFNADGITKPFKFGLPIVVSQKSGGQGRIVNHSIETGEYTFWGAQTGASSSSAGAGNELTIWNNGHQIHQSTVPNRSGIKFNEKVFLEELEIIPIEKIGLTQTPTEDPLVFADVFDNGILSRSGQFLLSELESLPTPRWSFTIISESEVMPVDIPITPIDTPESLFTRDKDGNKIYRVDLIDSITITDTK